MSEHKTLLQFLLDLLHNQDALADFRQDPQAALHAAGLEHVCVQDIQDLLPVVLEKADPEQCAKYEDDCDNDRCHDDAPKHHDPHHHGGHHWDDDHGHDGDHKWHDHDNEIDKVITHLNYVTNNYSFDSHDTVFTTNNITDVWANHSTVDVNNETHNVGSHGVSVEGTSNAPITTGDGNVVGDNNQIADHANAAFGAGSTALSGVSTGNGGAINTGLGTAEGHSDPLTNYGAHSTIAGEGSSLSDSGNHSDSHAVTKTTSDSHDLTNSQNHDSGNTETHTDTDTDNSTNTDLSQHNETDNSIHAHDSGVTVHDPAFSLVP